MWIRFLPALSKYKRWIKKIISNYDEHICWFETRSIFMNSFFSVVEFPRISDKRYCNGANLIYFIFAKLNFSRAMMTERRTIAQSNLKEEIDKCHAFAMLWTSRYYPDRCCKKLAHAIHLRLLPPFSTSGMLSTRMLRCRRTFKTIPKRFFFMHSRTCWLHSHSKIFTIKAALIYH